MPRKRVRMIDVATAAGVSPTTASFVLNGRDASIPAETKQRVLTAARQLAYRPNAAARALATGRTHRLGIAFNTPDSFNTSDTYFSDILAGVVSRVLCHDYNLLLHTVHYRDWRELYGDILSGSCDGVLLVGRYAGDELTTALLEAEFPAVCISFSIEHPACYSVDCDNETAGCMAVRHLLRLGHERIAFFYPGEEMSWGRERHAGARHAMREAGLSVDNLICYPWAETSLPSVPWTLSAIEFLKAQRPTAFVACDERRAQKIVELLPEHGLRVPDDIAVVSFNSTEVSARSHPPITSIWQPLRDIGEAAVDMLIARINNEDMIERTRRLPVRLDVRDSCGGGEAVVHSLPAHAAVQTSEARLPGVTT